jgi:uroporphyrinogen-III decarboxylase
VALAHKEYVAHHIPQDAEMGIPAGHWELAIEFGNVYEESWFGCEIVFPEGQIATTRPRYPGAAKYAVFERGLPGPFDGFMGQIRETYEFFVEKARTSEFLGRPIRVHLPVALGTDGPLTVANGIRGSQIFEDMLDDEQYYHELMDFITEATIQRIKAWRAAFNLDPKPRQGGLADDAVQFLSTRTYREKVLPYHRRFLSALYGEGPHGIHLCGNVQRLFPVLIQELNIKSFDTGFPIRFDTLRAEIGEDIEIQGGVPVGELVTESPQAVFQKTKTILASGIARGGKFILKEANDLAPCTPIANMQAMYAAVKTFGAYQYG